MKKKTKSRVLTMQEYFNRQCTSGVIPASCKMLFKFDETAGLPRETVSGAVYDPDVLFPDVWAEGEPTVPGYVEYTRQYAAHIQNPTDPPRPVFVDWNITSPLSKVLISVAHVVTPYSQTGPRAAVGTLNYGNVLTISTSGGMHGAFQVGYDVINNPVDIGEWIFIAADPTLTLPQDELPRTLYAMWNGITRELTIKVLNEDGTVYNNDTSDYVATRSIVEHDGGVIPDFTKTEVTYNQSARYSLADHYYAAYLEYDAVPANLDYKLAMWGRAARAGYKGAPDLS